MELNFDLTDYVKTFSKRIRKNYKDLPSHSLVMERLAHCMGYSNFPALKQEFDALTYDDLYSKGLKFRGILDSKIAMILGKDKVSDTEEEKFCEWVDYFYGTGKFRVEHAFLFGGHSPVDVLWEKNCTPPKGYKNEFTFPFIGSFNARLENNIDGNRPGFRINGFGDTEKLDQHIDKLIDYVVEKNKDCLIFIESAFLPEETVIRLEHSNQCVRVNRNGSQKTLVLGKN